MERCPYCEFRLEPIEEELEGCLHTVYCCTMCGWCRSVVERVPEDTTLKEILAAGEIIWWECGLYDFEFKEEAEAYKKENQLSGEVVPWTIKERGELPVLYWLDCPLCGKQIPAEQHDLLEIHGHCGCGSYQQMEGDDFEEEREAERTSESE